MGEGEIVLRNLVSLHCAARIFSFFTLHAKHFACTWLDTCASTWLDTCLSPFEPVLEYLPWYCPRYLPGYTLGPMSGYLFGHLPEYLLQHLLAWVPVRTHPS